MNIEAIFLNVFLNENETGGEENKRIWMSYDIPNAGGGACHIGDNSMHPVQVAERIVKALEEETFSILFPKVVESISFHNGRKDGVPRYNGKNDEVLTDKLNSHYYREIIDLLRNPVRHDLHPRIFYYPKIFYVL